MAGIDIDPQWGFAYKRTLFLSEDALGTGVRAYDFVHILRLSVLANFGAYGYSSLDALVADVFPFAVDTNPGVTRDKRAPHFA